MQAWEYLFMVCDRNEQGGWMPRVINGKEIPGWFEGPPVHQASNDLGDKGWELVSYSFVPSPYPASGIRDGVRLVFKRPK